ncbi:GNAT family N-acetyltransferase [Enterovibrio norvegicus FF-454]|uniref:GNAT family N-acetyltransferase n=2 Tax=Enterovibrio norvegicus TaxID=188144 RepID=A0A1E5BZD1_9GAMM|nr:GNAT family N-acetyltransferase [Enterovibrio norvegicus FF-454]
MDAHFRPVDLDNDLDKCITFRRDTWLVSYGTTDGFCANDAIKWFHHLSQNNPSGFIHIWFNGSIVGQLEFKSDIDSDDEKRAGYVNLFYLKQEYRGSGLGQIAHDYVVEKLFKNRCHKAMLRVIPGNLRAEAFYVKNGWYREGDASERGQLMCLDITGDAYGIAG